jgi:hypothetical protein
MTAGINFDLYHQRVLDFNHYNTGKIIIKRLAAFIFIVVSGGIECDVENIHKSGVCVISGRDTASRLFSPPYESRGGGGDMRPKQLLVFSMEPRE